MLTIECVDTSYGSVLEVVDDVDTSYIYPRS
jgi:hypothetical protein